MAQRQICAPMEKRFAQTHLASFLQSAQKNVQTLSDAAKGQQADAIEIGPETLDEEGQKQDQTNRGHLDHMVESVAAWEGGTNTDPKGASATDDHPGRQPLLLVSGIEGIGVATPKEMVLASEYNLYTVSQRDTQQSTARRWLHNVGKKISLFVVGIAGKFNLRLITAKGHAQLQAQSGNIEITADKNVRLYGSKQKVSMAATQEALFMCGGAYIRLKDGNIEIHAPGKVCVKSDGQSFTGPDSMNKKMPVFPIGDIPDDVISLEHLYHDGTPLAGAEYALTLPDGKVIKGKLDSAGRAQVKVAPGIQSGAVEYGPMPSSWKITDTTPNPSKGSVPSRIDSLIDKYAGDLVKKADAAQGEEK